MATRRILAGLPKGLPLVDNGTAAFGPSTSRSTFVDAARLAANTCSGNSLSEFFVPKFDRTEVRSLRQAAFQLGGGFLPF